MRASLADVSDELAAAVVTGDILPQLVYSLAEQNRLLCHLFASLYLNLLCRYYKKAAAFVLRTVAKHSPQLAQVPHRRPPPADPQAVVDSGAVSALVTCLEEFDPGVKEAAAWALGYIARHTTGAHRTSSFCTHVPELAQAVVDNGAVPQLILCLQEPEISLKRISASAISDIAKHTPELAQVQ